MQKGQRRGRDEDLGVVHAHVHRIHEVDPMEKVVLGFAASKGKRKGLGWKWT